MRILFAKQKRITHLLNFFSEDEINATKLKEKEISTSEDDPYDAIRREAMK